MRWNFSLDVVKCESCYSTSSAVHIHCVWRIGFMNSFYWTRQIAISYLGISCKRLKKRQ